MSKKATFWGSSSTFLLSLMLILSVRWLFFEPYVIPSGSMIPTLLIHDHIVVNKWSYGVRLPFTDQWLIKKEGPQRGDVVVFRSVDKSGIFMIKRIVALPGDEIEYTSQGELLINGQAIPQVMLTTAELLKSYPLSEEAIGGGLNRYAFYQEDLGDHQYISMLTGSPFHWEQQKTVVPQGHYFAMGDNRDNSRDSRSWGFVPRKNLIGKAMFVWLSCEQTLAFASLLCDPTTIRWNRISHGLNH